MYFSIHIVYADFIYYVRSIYGKGKGRFKGVSESQNKITETVRQVCISISTTRNEVGAGNKRLPDALRQGYTR